MGGGTQKRDSTGSASKHPALVPSGISQSIAVLVQQSSFSTEPSRQIQSSAVELVQVPVGFEKQGRHEVITMLHCEKDIFYGVSMAT